MKCLITVLAMMVSMSSFAAETHGEFFMGTTGANMGTDNRAVIGVDHAVDNYGLHIAADFAKANHLFVAYLTMKGLLVDNDGMAAGYQPLSYSKYSEAKLHTRWIQDGLEADSKDIALTYSGEMSGLGYELQAHDAIPGDKKWNYSLLAHYALPKNMEVAGSAHYSPTAKMWMYNAALFGSYENLGGGLEVGNVVPKFGENMMSYALTATYANLYGNVGLFGQLKGGDDEWKCDNHTNLLVGPTLALAKGINAAALFQHVEGVNNAAVVRLAAAF